MKPFITACAGGAVEGALVLAHGWLPIGLNSAFGLSGLVAIPLMTSIDGILPAMGAYLCRMIISYVMGYVFTRLYGIKNFELN